VGVGLFLFYYVYDIVVVVVFNSRFFAVTLAFPD
jgi:hypothetical protein